MRTKPSEAVHAVRRLGGVAQTTQVQAAGISEHAIRVACAQGDLQHPRRGWLAVPDADPLLVGAARGGVVLSCVTQAARLGLWVQAPGRLHVAARSNASTVRVIDTVVVHWAQPAVPRPLEALIDSVENVLILAAGCLPQEEALAMWESALRKDLVTSAALGRLDLPPAARLLAGRADHWKDSGLESIVIPRLRFLRLRIVPQAWILDRPVDALIGDRLVLQVDGGTHVGPQRDKDISYDARLVLHGYTVLRVSYGQIMNDWPAVQHRIMLAVAQGLHLAA